MPQFRKKPIVVEAMQFFYDHPNIPGVFYPPISEDGKTYIGDAYVVTIHNQRAYLENGDWVITEPDGEHHYPCKPEIFEATYESVDSYKVRDDYKRGTVVAIDHHTGKLVESEASRSVRSPIGIAARDLQKGEMITYRLGENTADIVVFKKEIVAFGVTEE